MKVKDQFCSFCGTPHSVIDRYPRHCQACDMITYDNPRPVAVMLVPVGDGGLLVVQRGHHMDGGGKWALPGGFIDAGETWQTAGAREIFEETGVVVSAETIKHVSTVSTPDGHMVLIFGRTEPVAALPSFKDNIETIAVKVISAPIDLAFPIHTQIAAEFLKSNG